MEILPATTVADFSTSLQTTITENVAVIIGVIGLAVGIAFVTRWFNKGTKKIKAQLYKSPIEIRSGVHRNG